MNVQHLLQQRYDIKETLGRGGFATTYRAIDTATAQSCVIKCLSFRKMKEWKTWELFEREAKTLKNLNHPQIPKYVDFFTQETEQDVELYLVQEYVAGKSLAQLIQEGRHFTEQEAVKLAISVTRILEYLHHFSPPIIHRDIKPSNLILPLFDVKEQQEVGYHRAFLIDFGAVKEKVQDELSSIRGAPTVVGTYGYMPLEQIEGRAAPTSDIYALGMTLIHALSHKEPTQLEKHGLQVDFRSQVNISRQFAAILERMIAPDWQKRYQNAAELRGDLERLVSGKPPVKASSSKLPRSIMAAAIIFLLTLVGFGVGISMWIFTRSATPPVVIEISPTPITLPSPTVSLISTPPPFTPPPSILDQPLIMPTEIPTPILSIPSPTLPAPEPSPTPEKVIYPSSGRISLDIYRDFTYIPQGWPLGLSVGQTSTGGLETLPYERLIREPRYRSMRVLYGYLPLGNGDDRQIAFALDELENPTWVAYVDANNNEDLTDDPPYRNEGTGIFAANINVTIDIVTLDNRRIHQPYRLWMWVTESKQRAFFYATCHYASKISILGQRYDVIAFEQFQHNGLFRESGVWIDLNHDQKLDEKTEHFQDGEDVPIGGLRYRIALRYP